MGDASPFEPFLEHYRSLRERFTSQGDRLWLRFYYFLTIDAALLGVLLTKVGAPPSQLPRFVVPFLGLFWTAIWFVIGAQDLWFYEQSRKKLDAFKSKHVVPNIAGWDEDREYYAVPRWKKLICFKIPKCGVTTFAAICPLLFLPVWFVMWKIG